MRLFPVSFLVSFLFILFSSIAQADDVQPDISAIYEGLDANTCNERQNAKEELAGLSPTLHNIARITALYKEAREAWMNHEEAFERTMVLREWLLDNDQVLPEYHDEFAEIEDLLKSRGDNPKEAALDKLLNIPNWHVWVGQVLSEGSPDIQLSFSVETLDDGVMVKSTITNRGSSGWVYSAYSELGCLWKGDGGLGAKPFRSASYASAILADIRDFAWLKTGESFSINQFIECSSFEWAIFRYINERQHVKIGGKRIEIATWTGRTECKSAGCTNDESEN